MKNNLTIFAGVSLLIVAIAFALHLVIKPPADALEQMAVSGGKLAEAPGKIVQDLTDFGKYGIDKFADAFTVIFQSQVHVSSSATVCDATPIAELAVEQRNIREIIDYSKTDYASTKHIIAEQTFTAKNGFDLASKFTASYNPSNQVVTIILPEPKILSLEALNPAPVYYLDESGYINKITTRDHQQILIQLKETALKSADAALALSDAKQMIETRFHDLFRAFNVKVVVSFSPSQLRAKE
jgi:hypothetical protein